MDTKDNHSESFILRVYRWNVDEKEEETMGVLEHEGSGLKLPFFSKEHLWAIIRGMWELCQQEEKSFKDKNQ